jgi:hypothetical protein
MEENFFHKRMFLSAVFRKRGQADRISLTPSPGERPFQERGRISDCGDLHDRNKTEREIDS